MGIQERACIFLFGSHCYENMYTLRKMALLGEIGLSYFVFFSLPFYCHGEAV